MPAETRSQAPRSQNVGAAGCQVARRLTAPERRSRGAGALAGALALFLAACTPLEQPRQRAEERASEQIHDRLGLFYPPPWPEVAAADLGEEAAHLLAEGLDEDSAVRVALLENRSLRADFERLGVAAYDRVRAGLLANPVLGATILFYDPGTELEFSLGQPLVDLFQRSMRRDLAESELEDARLGVVGNLVHLVYDVRRALLAQVAQEERHRLAEAALVAAREAETLSTELHRAGNVTDLELSRKVRARAEAELISLAEAQDLLEHHEHLIARLGLSQSFLGPVRIRVGFGELPPAIAEKQAERVMSRNLNLARLDTHIAAAQRRAGLSPSADVLSSAEVGAAAAKDDGESSFGLGPSVSLPLPIFDTGRAGSAAANAKWRALVAEREAERREIAATMRKLSARRAALLSQATLARDDLLASSRRVMVQTLQQYNAMQIGAFHVLEERSAEIHDERKALDLWEAAWMAHWDWEQCLAGVTPDANRHSETFTR